jgi:hypothetical protein
MKVLFGTGIVYFNNLNDLLMNEENFEYLSNNLKCLGFGEDLNVVLKEELQKHQSEFRLTHITVFGKDDLQSILHFRKSHINEMYFFDKYYLHLRKHDEPGELVQPFYIYKGKGITCKEGYNLLCGRAINKDLTDKEGEVYNAWLQLDLSVRENESYKIKQYNQTYGFELIGSLSRLPIQELSDANDRERLIRSLEKGNLQPVTFIINSQDIRMWIAANPRFKSINVYDSNRQLVKEFTQVFRPINDIPAQKDGKGCIGNDQKTGEENKQDKRADPKPDKGIKTLVPGQERAKRKRISI